MRKILTLVLLATTAIATPAMAQTSASGTVAVTGTVAGRCTASPAITGTIALGELTNTAGKIDSAFPNTTTGLSKSFSVLCTSANASITVSSTNLVNSTDATTLNGYTGTVHYTSTLTAQKAGGGADASAVYTSADTLPAATTTLLADRLKNAANNVTVVVSNGTTTNAGDLLKQGTYGSTITITVAPV